MVCNGCRAWVKPLVDRAAETVRCAECGHEERFRCRPLFIVTGTSGAGKTAVIPELRRLLPECDVFETDVLWDSGGDWSMVKCNWLRIAYSIAQSGRHTILCGTMQPTELEQCDHYPFFRRIHWLALHCDDEARASRLRERRGTLACSEEFIEEHHRFARWLLENAQTAFDPPLTVLDTTRAPVAETAARIHDWVQAALRDPLPPESASRPGR